jgi:hypothetical protein
MSYSRRSFIKWAASVSAMAVAGPRGLGTMVLRGAAESPLRRDLLPTQKQVWDDLAWMAKLGPKYTGNPAHTEFVEFLARNMKEAGLDVARERYTLPRWEAKRWEISVGPSGGSAAKIPVTSYFPYSGQTPAAGVSGPLVYAGTSPDFKTEGLAGKVVLIDFHTSTRQWSHEYQAWGVNPPGEHFPDAIRPARAGVSDLTKFAKAGALAVILGWTDVSDGNAADQYSPFSRPPQGIPGVYVGRETLAKLRGLAGSGAQATVVLEAQVFPDTPTDTVIATLPGQMADEVIIVNTHTDGPNATEENGAVGILALARYFSKIPKSERRRTLVMPLTTGHFAGPWVPSMRGIIQKYPDLIKKAVAAVTVEHLGCQEWMDDASYHYKATGKNEWSVAITPDASMGHAMVEALSGSIDRCGVVNPVNGGWLGEGGGLSRAGVPTIGYIPQPNYLLAGPVDTRMPKLSAELMHNQVETSARVIHKIDTMSRAELKGQA